MSPNQWIFFIHDTQFDKANLWECAHTTRVHVYKYVNVYMCVCMRCVCSRVYSLMFLCIHCTVAVVFIMENCRQLGIRGSRWWLIDGVNHDRFHIIMRFRTEEKKIRYEILSICWNKRRIKYAYNTSNNKINYQQIFYFKCRSKSQHGFRLFTAIAWFSSTLASVSVCVGF